MKLVRILSLLRLEFVPNIHQLPHGLLLTFLISFGLIHVSFLVNINLSLGFTLSINRDFLELRNRGAAHTNHPAGFDKNGVRLFSKDLTVPITTDVLQVFVQFPHILLHFG